MKLTGRWTPEERIAVASAMLDGIMADIYAGSYGVPGKPNITSVQGILKFPAAELAPYVKQAQEILDQPHRGTIPSKVPR